MATLDARFFSKVRMTDGCWPWTGACHPQGYGTFRVGESVHYAHRVMYEQVCGPIPDGLEIDHLCHNERCVRPEHLEAVTRANQITIVVVYVLRLIARMAIPLLKRTHAL